MSKTEKWIAIIAVVVVVLWYFNSRANASGGAAQSS